MNQTPVNAYVRRGQQQRRLSLIFAGLMLFFVVALKIGLAYTLKDEQTNACAGARNSIAMLEQNYERIHHHYVVGDEEALQELVYSHTARVLSTCRAGGHYSAVAILTARSPFIAACTTMTTARGLPGIGSITGNCLTGYVAPRTIK